MDGFLLGYDGFDPGAEGLREALTSTGNGYLCTRGAAAYCDRGPYAARICRSVASRGR